jgi:ankyrin repeat protein
MSIFQDARGGSLVGERLNSYIRSNRNIINKEEPSTGLTPLAIAVIEGFEEEVEQLIKKGAETDFLSEEGETLLVLAASKSKKERPRIIQLLLTKIPASLVNQKHPSEEKTPLIYAIEKRDAESIRLLIKAGADSEATNRDRVTANQLARDTKDSEIVLAMNQKERGVLGFLADYILNFMLHVTAWINDALDGIVDKVSGLFGENNPSIDEVKRSSLDE